MRERESSDGIGVLGSLLYDPTPSMNDFTTLSRMTLVGSVWWTNLYCARFEQLWKLRLNYTKAIGLKSLCHTLFPTRTMF